MKRNYPIFLARAISCLLIFAVIYEATSALLNAYPQIKEFLFSSNLIMIVITWLAIPVVGIGSLVGAFIYVRKGLDAPRLKVPRLNWGEGIWRIFIFFFGFMCVIGVVIIFARILEETGDIAAAFKFLIIVAAVVVIGVCIIRAADSWISKGFRKRNDDDESE